MLCYVGDYNFGADPINSDVIPLSNSKDRLLQSPTQQSIAEPTEDWAEAETEVVMGGTYRSVNWCPMGPKGSRVAFLARIFCSPHF